MSLNMGILFGNTPVFCYGIPYFLADAVLISEYTVEIVVSKLFQIINITLTGVWHNVCQL